MASPIQGFQTNMTVMPMMTTIPPSEVPPILRSKMPLSSAPARSNRFGSRVKSSRPVRHRPEGLEAGCEPDREDGCEGADREHCEAEVHRSSLGVFEETVTVRPVPASGRGQANAPPARAERRV